MSDLMLHRGTTLVTRTDLALVPLPEATRTWHPVPHLEVLDTVIDRLAGHSYEVVREQLGLAKDGARFFATLDLRSPLADGVTMSVGIRNGHDRKFPMGFAAGSRTFVCDNLCFSGERVVATRHTRQGALVYGEQLMLAVNSLAKFAVTEEHRIARLQLCQLAPYQAESVLVEAFERGLLSTQTLPGAIRQLRAPECDWGPQDRAWHLFNAMNFVMQRQAGTAPTKFAGKTMRLTSLLAEVVGFEESPNDLVAVQQNGGGWVVPTGPLAADERGDD